MPASNVKVTDAPDVRIREALNGIRMSMGDVDPSGKVSPTSTSTLISESENFPDNFHYQCLQTVAHHLNAICFMAKIIESNIKEASDECRLEVLVFLRRAESEKIADPVKKLLTPVFEHIKKLALEKATTETTL